MSVGAPKKDMLADGCRQHRVQLAISRLIKLPQQGRSRSTPHKTSYQANIVDTAKAPFLDKRGGSITDVSLPGVLEPDTHR